MYNFTVRHSLTTGMSGMSSAPELQINCPICFDVYPKLAYGLPPSAMKKDTHPGYEMTEISCACGAVYRTRSTRRNVKVGICAACHPLFTGEQRFVDTAGRVERFARRYGSLHTSRPARPKRVSA
ncbi:50S ribosomal protein L31 [Candidatus Xiphinematobacter sp. Idaho Grape]|nr:50S ribosomal protein L31 [Candidatus Xiphinematobacter sp. Idaho Grape]